jgi:nucleoside-diphosphate-sugar epimerase
MKSNKLFVTGAGGFIGARVVEMALQQGYQPIAGIRGNRGIPRLARLGVEIRKCDVLALETLVAAFEGCGTVVHCAMSDGPSIVEGTDNVLQAAQTCGVARVVFISSVAVYGSQEGNIDESVPLQSIGWYGEAKIKAEEICSRYLQRGMDITTLRPGIVYGPFCKLWTLRYYDRFRYGQLNLLSHDSDGYCNAVYVDDVVRAIFAAANQPKGASGIYNVVGPESPHWNDFFRCFQESLSGKPLAEPTGVSKLPKDHLLLKLLRSTAKYLMEKCPDLITYCRTKFSPAKKLMKRTEGLLKYNLDSHELSLYRLRGRYQVGAMRNKLGCPPTIGLEEGMKRTANYLKVYFE